MKITAGFVQFTPVRRDVGTNIKNLRDLLGGVRADLLVLPELANSGYAYASAEELGPFSEQADGSGPFLSALQELAGESGALIVSGFAENTSEGLYNSAAAVSAEGVQQVYRKTHLFGDELDLFLPGNSGLKVLDYEGLRIGLMICFDWIFPEAARTLALKGAQVLAHPSNLVLPYCQQAMFARSLENGVFSITANRCGTEDLGEKSLTFTGRSQVLDVRGNPLCLGPLDGDCVETVEINLEDADNKWVTARNHLFKDRRPEMYQ